MQNLVSTTPTKFFSIEDVRSIASAKQVPVVKGKVFPGEERNSAWSVECDSFEDFAGLVGRIPERIEFLAFDESVLDEETLSIVQDDVHRYAEEENLVHDTVNKALAALRSHENELFAVLAYAFLASGRIVFVRAQNELAKFVYNPSKLLSAEGLTRVRKLKTLDEASTTEEPLST